jgi:HSP20 family protein
MMKTLQIFQPKRSPLSFLDSADSLERFFDFDIDMPSLFEDDLNGGFLTTFKPALNLTSDSENYHVTMDLPGMKREDIEINFDDINHILQIAGTRDVKIETEPKMVSDTKEKQPMKHVVERFMGSFARSLYLENATSKGIDANLKDGVLSVMIPKIRQSNPKKIEIKGEPEGSDKKI